MSKKVLVCSINFNTSIKTIEMIKSANFYNSINKFEVFIIDNSDNYSEQQIMQKYCENSINKINYIKSTENVGYALAMNPFFDYAVYNNFDSIIFMNNDLILEKNALDLLVNFSKKYTDGIYCSLQKSNDEERLITCTGTIKTDTIIGGRMAPYIGGEFIEVDFVISAVMLIETSLYKRFRIKFNEFYFLYVEENDLCYRYKKLGIKSYVVNKSICYHDNGGSSGGIKNPVIWYYRIRNTLRYDWKIRNLSPIKLSIKIIYLFFVTLKKHKLNIKFYLSYYNSVVDYKNLNIIKK
jgi:GT2 family glycosyltransferase